MRRSKSPSARRPTAAEEGARATTPMQARKGRASYLGERSIGHQDPGATSAALIMRALERAVVQGGLMGQRVVGGAAASPGVAVGAALLLNGVADAAPTLPARDRDAEAARAALPWRPPPRGLPSSPPAAAGRRRGARSSTRTR